jgi:hypothetical protein
MKKTLKYLSVLFLLAAVASCGDDSVVNNSADPDGPEIPEIPEPDAPVALISEEFSDNTLYLTPAGAPLPASFTDGYFQRTVSDENVEDFTMKVLLKQCRLDPSEPGVTVDGQTTSAGRIQIGAGTGAIETALFSSVSSVSMVIAGVSSDPDATTAAHLMVRSPGGDWELFARSPSVSGDSPCRWVLDKQIMKHPVALKIVQDPEMSTGALALYELEVDGLIYEPEPEPAPTDILLQEGFYNDGDGIKTFFLADDRPFPGSSWNTGEGYFERTVGEQTIRVRLNNARIDFTQDRISIYGESTSKGRMQLGTGGATMEFPVFGSVNKLTLFLSAGTAGDVATRALIQYRSKGTSEWKDFAMSPDVTANAPVKWIVEGFAAEPMALRIMQDPAITKGNSLVIYDMTVQGVPDTGVEDAPEVTILDERFRAVENYMNTDTGEIVARNTWYNNLHFDRVVEGKTIHVTIKYAALYNRTMPPEPNLGATEGCLNMHSTIDTEPGYLEMPIFGAVRSATFWLKGDGSATKAVLQIMRPGESSWTDYATSGEIATNAITMWELTDISTTPVAMRLVSTTANLSIFNIKVVGKLY